VARRLRLTPFRLFTRVAVTAAAAVFALIAALYVTLPDVRALASANPATTAFMELRAGEAARDGRTARRVHEWVPYSRISPHLTRAVLVAEDDAFWDHEGIDIQQIRRSLEINLEQGAAVRGASTITQQLAKNLYLSPSRNPLRKLRELIIARRMEAELSKARIFEIYLNVIEWGDGVWGAEAAARTYFGVPASALGREQAALLAGAIVNPRVLDPARPSARLLSRQRLILGRMGGVEPPAPAIPAIERDLGVPFEAAPALPVDELPFVPPMPRADDEGIPAIPPPLPETSPDLPPKPPLDTAPPPAPPVDPPAVEPGA
jgi:monofunctional biosynthetic peptidoglycan transglycosylase